MAKASVATIRKFLADLGLDKNPIERITHHKDGSTTIWVVGLGPPPLKMEAPAPKPRRRKKAAKAAPLPRGDTPDNA